MYRSSGWSEPDYHLELSGQINKQPDHFVSGSQLNWIGLSCAPVLAEQTLYKLGRTFTFVNVTLQNTGDVLYLLAMVFVEQCRREHSRSYLIS